MIMSCFYFNCYVIIALILLASSLMAYGVNQSFPYEERIFKYSSSDVWINLTIIISTLWPLFVIGIIIYGLGALPILLGKYIGKIIYKIKAKKDFKELIFNNKKGEN